MEPRFNFLRLLSRIFKVLGVLALLITIVLAIGILSATFGSLGESDEITLMSTLINQIPRSGIITAGLTAVLLAILNGSVIAASLFALGEGLLVLLTIEENTRASAMLLGRMSKREKET